MTEMNVLKSKYIYINNHSCSAIYNPVHILHAQEI